MVRLFLAVISTTVFVAANAHATDVNVKKFLARSNFSQPTNTVYLVEGANLAPRVKTRIEELLRESATVVVGQPPAQPAAGSLIIAIGDTPASRALITDKDLAAQGPEGFIVRSSTNDAGVTTLATNGNPAQGERTTSNTNRGVSYGAYEILQQIGYHFFHPFTPQAPHALNVPSVKVNVVEKPRWPRRGLHLHTMHPIELSHVLNAWGPNGPGDAPGFNSELHEWDLFLEWMLAHRQNQVEWVLLADKTHQTFNDSDERAQRLKTLVNMAHGWGLLAGIDVGIVFEQQNMWRLLRSPGADANDSTEIRSRLKWLMRAGWDFVTAEMGTSEFTSPDDVKTVFWMNTLTDEMERVYNRFAAVKVHISQGQQAKHYSDPETHQALNFNFLPIYADKRLAVLPHTVELYSLDDPAPTYGNTNFGEINRFMQLEAGQRPMMFYPESAYWVSYDIDTPLFLPSYAERRMHDLRLISREEDAGLLGRGANKGARMQGQLLFTSGFEWGYWFNDLVAMHAAWNPRSGENERTAFENITHEILRPDPASEATTHALGELLSDTIIAQDDILIHGKVNGKNPRQIERLTGIAYLSGVETWDEINTSLGDMPLADILGIKNAATQPNRLGFRSLRSDNNGQGVDYAREVHPLLDAMEVSFSNLSQKMIDLYKQAPATDTNKDVLAEFADGALINTLRASQVHALYDADAAVTMGQNPQWRDAKLARARQAIDVASQVVARREQHYRSTTDGIARWGQNPTVYNYGYLWTVHSLFWWYRDEGIVVQQPSNACFMNIVNPADTVLAEGRDNTWYQWAQKLADLSGLGSINECLNPSTVEPQPRLRVRGHQ